MSSEAADARLTPVESRFLSVPSNASARASLEYLTSKPHVAGTPGDYEMAQYVKKRFIEAGIANAIIDPQNVLLTYPNDRSLELVDENGKVMASASLSEQILASDPTSDTWWRNHTFNGYSPSGVATAPVVYANFGLPEDFDTLAAAGVSVEGAIALMRYGKCFRGLKAMNAQKAGAVAAIIYSDPAQDGYAQGSVYPYGPWRPESSVQRGSIQFISLCAGDPTRAYAPHGRSVEDVCGKKAEELIPQIPVLPISYSDALIFLNTLGGQEAPNAFRGALNITYRTGPTKNNLRAALRLRNSFQKSPVWNVIATIAGAFTGREDQPVVLGNHRDAWVYGAADPNSGTAQLIEVAKGLGHLLKTGWRPKRTIILASWSGEEYGLLGSTAWGEVHGDSAVHDVVSSRSLLSRAVAYLNVDTGVSGPHFGASGTPSLGRVLAGVLGQVRDPLSQKPLSEHWEDGDLYALGSGSDYTVFIDHLGIPSLDMHFSQKVQYGAYHSVYDSFTWMETEGDPTFQYHVAMAKVWGLVSLRLSGTEHEPLGPLPFNVTLQAEAIGGYIADVKTMLNATTKTQVNFSPLDNAHVVFSMAARSAMAESARLASDPPSPSRFRDIMAINDRLALYERSFLTAVGLPGRKWFRHCLQAPGLYTGYAPQTLPGVHHAISNNDWGEAREQVDLAAHHIAAAAKFLSSDESFVI